MQTFWKKMEKSKAVTGPAVKTVFAALGGDDAAPERTTKKARLFYIIEWVMGDDEAVEE